MPACGSSDDRFLTISHLSQWSVGQLKRLVRRHGFEIVAVEGTGRISRRIGTIFPVVPFYGSYMLVAKLRRA